MKTLLATGAIAGPLYVIVSAIEAFTRKGFNPTRHDLSFLSNGDLGWIHIGLFIVCGLLTILGALGLRCAWKGGKGGTWGPLLLGLYGVGLVAAGIFVADPAMGFPPGPPDTAPAITINGIMHLVSGTVGFLGLVAACLVAARRFASSGRRGRALFSRITGVFYLVAFFGIATGSQQQGTVLTTVILTFTAAVILGWIWISMVLIAVRAEI